MRGRPKGQPKFGGRKKGTANKSSKELRERISMILDNKFDAVMQAFDRLDDKEKVKAYTDLMKYSVPTLQAVSLDATVKKDDSVEEDLKALSEEE